MYRAGLSSDWIHCHHFKHFKNIAAKVVYNNNLNTLLAVNNISQFNYKNYHFNKRFQLWLKFYNINSQDIYSINSQYNHQMTLEECNTCIAKERDKRNSSDTWSKEYTLALYHLGILHDKKNHVAIPLDDLQENNKAIKNVYCEENKSNLKTLLLEKQMTTEEYVKLKFAKKINLWKEYYKISIHDYSIRISRSNTNKKLSLEELQSELVNEIKVCNASTSWSRAYIISINRVNILKRTISSRKREKISLNHTEQNTQANTVLNDIAIDFVLRPLSNSNINPESVVNNHSSNLNDKRLEKHPKMYNINIPKNDYSSTKFQFNVLPNAITQNKSNAAKNSEKYLAQQGFNADLMQYTELPDELFDIQSPTGAEKLINFDYNSFDPTLENNIPKGNLELTSVPDNPKLQSPILNNNVYDLAGTLLMSF